MGIRPGGRLEAMLFQNLQTVFLCFVLLKTGLRVVPEPLGTNLPY